MSMQEHVLDICTAYEEGFSCADQGLGVAYNKFPIDTEKYYAWHYGHSNSLSAQMIDGLEIQFTPDN